MTDGPRFRWHHFPRFRWILLVGLGGLVLLWLAPIIASLVSSIDISSLDRPYLVVFSFVAFDAVIPIFPSESLLTTASNLAAQSGSEIELWRVILAGAAGAIVGATMGLTRYPYRRFLLWDAIGGTLWASYTCIFSYLVASVIDDKPVLSIAISVVVTTAILALLYKPLKSSWDDAEPGPDQVQSAGTA